MRALILANGEPPSAELVAEFAADADILVCADGGGNTAVALGLEPAIVIGDLDSVTDATRAALPNTRFIRDRDPDTTDLQKAIGHAISLGATAIDVLGASGGRADHALGNLSLLVLFGRQVHLRLIDEQFEISLVNGSASIRGPEGTIVSLLAIGVCEGVTTHGLRWPLHDHTLFFSPFGIHNEVASQPATVEVRQGDLLLFNGRWVEKHR